MDKIFDLAWNALEINRTFSDGTYCKEGLKPNGFLPPDKRARIIEILEEILEISKPSI